MPICFFSSAVNFLFFFSFFFLLPTFFLLLSLARASYLWESDKSMMTSVKVNEMFAQQYFLLNKYVVVIDPMTVLGLYNKSYTLGDSDAPRITLYKLSLIALSSRYSLPKFSGRAARSRCIRSFGSYEINEHFSWSFPDG